MRLMAFVLTQIFPVSMGESKTQENNKEPARKWLQHSLQITKTSLVLAIRFKIERLSQEDTEYDKTHLRGAAVSGGDDSYGRLKDPSSSSSSQNTPPHWTTVPSQMKSLLVHKEGRLKRP